MNHKLISTAILVVAGIALSGNAVGQKVSLRKASFATARHKSAVRQPAKTKPKTLPPIVLSSDKDKASYAIGMNLGKNLQRDGIDIDTAILKRGMDDALGGKKLLMTDEESQAAIIGVQQQARAKRAEELKELGDANKKEGAAFLAANKSKPGVVTLPSGLEYKVETQGKGPKPTASDTVVCNYRGTLINGKEFDSSYKRGRPATFPVSGVIKGWTEVLQLMPVGSKYKVFIPAELAYGPRSPGEIGPNSTLIFDIELLSIKDKPADAAVPTPSTPGAAASSKPKSGATGSQAATSDSKPAGSAN